MAHAGQQESLTVDPRTPMIPTLRGELILRIIGIIGCVLPNDSNDSNDSYIPTAPRVRARTAVR